MPRSKLTRRDDAGRCWLLLAGCPCGRSLRQAGRPAAKSGKTRPSTKLLQMSCGPLVAAGVWEAKVGREDTPERHQRLRMTPPGLGAGPGTALPNGEACEAQAVAPLAGQFVLPDWTVQYGERYRHTPAWLRDGWVGTGDWQVPVPSSSCVTPHYGVLPRRMHFSCCDSV